MPEHPEDELIERVARELRTGIRFDAQFDARVMEAVRAQAWARTSSTDGAPPRVLPRTGHWLTRRHVVRVRPLAGLAAAAGFAGLVAATTLAFHGERGARGEASAPVVAATPAADSQAVRIVQFVLRVPGASSVSLVGDFNDWDLRATPLRAVSRDGTWTVSLPLAQGRHVYAFVVDGEEWVADPAAPMAPGEDFGVPNSVVMVGASL